MGASRERIKENSEKKKSKSVKAYEKERRELRKILFPRKKDKLAKINALKMILYASMENLGKKDNSKMYNWLKNLSTHIEKGDIKKVKY